MATVLNNRSVYRVFVPLEQEQKGTEIRIAVKDRRQKQRAKNAQSVVAMVDWTVARALQVLALFLLAGLAEIGGGWLVWKAVREGKPWWWSVAGSFVLVAYGFIPTLQPLDDFGRLYAVYGGVFIGLSFAWGVAVDGMVIDRGDVVGSCVALLGVLLILFYPREGAR
jgi:drug/metabolite transporter superfamily protein YnfA